MFLGVGLFAVVGLFGCNQETSIEKTKAAAASGNAATQAAGQAAVDRLKTPLDKARQVENTLEKSAEQTAAKTRSRHHRALAVHVKMKTGGMGTFYTLGRHGSEEE